jgi:hypothetical protein
VSPSAPFWIEKIVNDTAAVNKVLGGGESRPHVRFRRDGAGVVKSGHARRIGQINTTNGDRRAW